MAKSRVRSTINIPLGRRYSLAKVVAGVDATTEEAVNQVVDILSIPPVRSGKKYPDLKNVSSKPGEAPAPQSGELRQGTARTPTRVKGTTVSSTVASRTNYAARLHTGDENMEPRPYLTPLRDEEPRRKRLLAAFIVGARRALTTTGGRRR